MKRLLILGFLIVAIGTVLRWTILAPRIRDGSQRQLVMAPIPAVTQEKTEWRFTEEIDEMDHSKIEKVLQSSSTSDAELEIVCSNKGSGNKLREHARFVGIFFSGTGSIAWINGRYEKVRYKFEDDVVHEPFWYTGGNHNSFWVTDFGLVKELIKHKTLSIEFSPGRQIARFNLQGLSEVLNKIQCGIEGAKGGAQQNTPEQAASSSDDAAYGGCVASDKASETGSVFRAGAPGVSSPTVLYKVDPVYPDEARKLRYSGTVVLEVVVDSTGAARDICVVRSLGLGLDENAIKSCEELEVSSRLPQRTTRGGSGHHRSELPDEVKGVPGLIASASRALTQRAQ